MAGRKRESVERLKRKGKTHLTKKEIKKREEQEEKIKKLNSNFMAPSHMSGKSRDVFNYIKRNLAEIDLLANVDKFNLCILAESIANYIQVSEQLKKEKYIVKHTNKKGHTNSKINPLVRVQNKYADQVRRFSSEFGLTPSARLKIIANNSEEQIDEFDQDFG